MNATPKPQDAVCVLDVGKTNKKLLLYDRALHTLATETIQLDAVDRDGLEHEQTDVLLAWMRRSLRALSVRGRIRGICITTHGATLATLDGEGRLSTPVISYTSPRGAEIEQEFYREFGDSRRLHADTSTAPLGFANAAKILFFIKTRLPDAWARTRHALFYPQYLAFELCGVASRETTYTGCHTYLWLHPDRGWSEVATRLGADRLFPARTLAPWDRIGDVHAALGTERGLPAECAVAAGIHDSNASLVPYIAKGQSNYVLNSTGSWCVAMRPSPDCRLSARDLDTKTFYNLDARGCPVKTSIFPGGMERAAFKALNPHDDLHEPNALAELCRTRDLFVLPGLIPDARVYPNRKPRVVAGTREIALPTHGAPGPLADVATLGQRYFAALNFALAMETREVLRLAGAAAGTTVFIEGGFTRNPTYCRLLASLMPECEVRLSNLEEATSFGAALCAWKMIRQCPIEEFALDFQLDTQRVDPLALPDLAAYEREFLRRIEAHSG